jgi:hypothetical protein
MQAYWVCQAAPLRLLHTQKYTQKYTPTHVSELPPTLFFLSFFFSANATLMKFAPRSVEAPQRRRVHVHTSSRPACRHEGSSQGMHAHTSSLLKEALPLTLCMHTRKVSKVSKVRRRPLRPHQTPQKCRNESMYTYVCIYTCRYRYTYNAGWERWCRSAMCV